MYSEDELKEFRGRVSCDEVGSFGGVTLVETWGWGRMLPTKEEHFRHRESIGDTFMDRENFSNDFRTLAIRGIMMCID